MAPGVLPFPVHVVSAGNIRADLLAGARGQRRASIPAFTRTVIPPGTVVPLVGEDGQGGTVVVGTRVLPAGRITIGMIRRQCTGNYKVMPIRRTVRDLAGIAGRCSPTIPVVEAVAGDFERGGGAHEAVRRGLARQPLAAGRAADDAARLPGLAGPAPAIRSRPAAPASAAPSTPTPSGGGCETAIPTPGLTPSRWTGPSVSAFAGICGEVYLHRSAVPLDEADLTTDADRGQLDLWPNECECLCGV